MAIRPIFISLEYYPFYKKQDVDFTFFSGFSVSQKQKSIISLHESAKRKSADIVPLEISTKSMDLLGVKLSAFNLQYQRNGEEYPIESIFQGSKVFEFGGPYVDLYAFGPKEAKRDERIRNSGRVIGFNLDGTVFSSEPKDFFYNWIYASALFAHRELLNRIQPFNAFTDIEFNPEKSINCQARTVAIVRGLLEAGLLEKAMESPDSFLRTVYSKDTGEAKQLSVFD